MSNRLHDDEIAIDGELVRKLVDSQLPEYAALPLGRLGASGSTNVLFRLGHDLLVRLPRQPDGSSSIDKEHRWLPEIGSCLPVATPDIVALGEPDFGFNERWSVVRWLEGELPRVYSPVEKPKADCSALAVDLADVIVALRGIDVSEAAITDPRLRHYRGRSLAESDAQVRKSIRQCRAIEGLALDLDSALAVWRAALDLPGASETGADRWYHGDLVAENLLLDSGRLTGVLDFGGLGVGDPTIDLHGAWELFDPPARNVFRARLGIGDAEWLRGRAWALAIALVAIPYYWATMPARVRDRLAMARSVLCNAADDGV